MPGDEGSGLFLRALPLGFFLFLCSLCNILYNVLVNLSVFMSSVSHSNNLIEPGEGLVRTPVSSQ